MEQMVQRHIFYLNAILLQIYCAQTVVPIVPRHHNSRMKGSVVIGTVIR